MEEAVVANADDDAIEEASTLQIDLARNLCTLSSIEHCADWSRVLVVSGERETLAAVRRPKLPLVAETSTNGCLPLHWYPCLGVGIGRASLHWQQYL